MSSCLSSYLRPRAGQQIWPDRRASVSYKVKLPEMDAHRLTQALKTHPKVLGVLETYWGLRPCFHPQVMEVVSSTNAVLWQQLNQGAPSGTVLLARRQQAGRGQWGRQWQSPPGGLYLSLALEPDLPLSTSSQFTLASAWGIVTSLSNLGLPVRVKWPNDLLLNQRKLGGILTESRIEDGRIQAVVIGVGLNWINPVPASGINLQQFFPGPLPHPLDRLEYLAAVVLYGLLQGYIHWQAHGTEALMAAYCSCWVHQGQAVTVNGHPGQVTGITAQGKLSVQIGLGHPTTEMLELEPGDIRLGYNA